MTTASFNPLRKALVGVLVTIAATPATELRAQTELPGIVVTTPSPVVRPSRKAAPAPIATPAETAVPTPPMPTGIILEDAFAPMTVIPSSEITGTRGSNLADTLQYRPGITGSNFAPGANRPVIRGLDSYRVRVQENGIGAHDVSALSEDHAVPIDPFAADRIEVVRGPATLRYGSQAIGGVVNAINDRIPEIIPPRGFSIETRGGLSSVDGGADGGFKATAGAGNFAVHADAFKRRAGDYATPAGRQFNTFVDSDGFAVGASAIGLDGFMGVAFSRTNSLYGIPGKDAIDNRTRIDMQQDKVQSRGEWRVRDHGIEAIRFWFGASSYAHNEIGFAAGPPEIGSRFTNRENEGRVEVQHLPVQTAFGELRGAVGTQLGQRKLVATSFEGDSLLDPARTKSIAAFWFEELQVTKRLRLQAAARIEQTRIDGTGLDLTAPSIPIVEARTFRPVSASAGILYELPLGVVARLASQYVERAPADAELFSKGVHEATETFDIGNPFLAKERAQTVELGFRKADGRLRFDASLYRTQFDGFIFKQRTGRVCDATFASCGSGSALNEVLFSQRDATFTGAELQAQLDIAPIWRGVWGIDGQYDFVRARFDDALGGNVPRIPPHRVGAGVYYRDTHWFARLGLLHAFAQTRIGEHETPTDGYTLLNAEFAYTFKLDSQGSVIPEMTIGLKGENLLDDDVRNHVSFLKDEVLQPGRTVRLYGIVKLN
ncbi:MAG: TonB-dependent receptor [Hyphomonadaceae bacterium]|nr:TonB-dependent receptor [Hyphomonadaceae bacterium]